MSSASDKALLADTIAAMKKAVKRGADETDSDSDIEVTTNRGNKLKKRARYVHQGQLRSTNGATIPKEMVEYAGYHRAIISHNPPLVDEDGFGLDSDDDEEHIQEVTATANEANPYASIRLEEILAPLTSIAELPNHPTFSRPFTSQALPGLANQASSLTHKENASLWKVRNLFTGLCGDNDWIPCGMMLAPNDADFFSSGYTTRFLNQIHNAPDSITGLYLQNGDNAPGLEKQSRQPAATEPDAPVSHQKPPEANQNANNEEDVAMQDSGPKKEGTSPSAGDGQPGNPGASNGDVTDDQNAIVGASRVPTGEAAQARNRPALTRAQQSKDATKDDAEGKEAAGDGSAEGKKEGADGAGSDVDMAETGQHENEQMSQGKQARATADRTHDRDTSVTPAASEELPVIHPMFIPPRSGRPDRDLGLPEQEADDVRRLLQLYIQKQEEVCRGANTLYHGLLKADRLRKTVFSWAKAEGHRGEMSDGEDWYDKQEWGLTEDLKKGQDEEEEDTAATAKKTRNRRG